MKVGDIFEVPDGWDGNTCPVCGEGTRYSWPCNFQGNYCDKDGKLSYGSKKYIKITGLCKNVPCICDQRVLLLADCQCFEESRKQYLEKKKKEQEQK